jgi:hypothetical protein
MSKKENTVPPGDDLLKPCEAAEFLKVSVTTLDYWRSRAPGSGPQFVRIGGRRGRIRYSREGLRAYVLGRTGHQQRTTAGKIKSRRDKETNANANYVRDARP